MKDIANIEDIHQLVDQFYGKVRVNPLIGPIFKGAIGGEWPKHLEKMYSFWQTVLLEQQTYFGSPFPPHANMPLRQEHFDHWLAIWKETVDKHFAGEKANEAKWRAEKMAEMFQYKLQAKFRLV